MIEYELSLLCPIKRCENGLIWLEPPEAKALGCPDMVMRCKECYGRGKLEELDLEKAP